VAGWCQYGNGTSVSVQSDLEGNVSILGGDNIGYCEREKNYVVCTKNNFI